MGIIKIIFVAAILVNPPVINQVRNHYFNASIDKKNLQELRMVIDKIKDKNQLYYCYLASVHALEAKHANSVTKKLNAFTQYRKLITKSFEIKDSYDARLIRFSVQLNSPEILNYKSELIEDKIYLIDHYRTLSDENFKKNVRNLLLSSGLLTTHEKNTLYK